MVSKEDAKPQQIASLEADELFGNAIELAAHLRALQEKRRNRKQEINSQGYRRKYLSQSNREEILRKTAGRCHICGGAIETDKQWAADHVLAHAQGGPSSVDNYLPAHTICNNYRWFYNAQEFQWIIKLGVWFRTQIERRNILALELADKFVRYEVRRVARRNK